MDPLFAEFQRVQRYIGWEDSDVERIRSVAPILLSERDALVTDFYETLMRHEETSRVITGGERQVERLKESLRGWIGDLCSCKYDADYVRRRWRIGQRHVEIGLKNVFMHAGFDRLRHRMIQAVVQKESDLGVDLQSCLGSLGKLLALDLALIEDAYEREYLNRALPSDERRLEQQRTVAQVSERALACSEFSELLDRTVGLVASALGAARTEYFELFGEGKALLRSAIGRTPAEIGRRSFPIVSGSVMAAACERSRPLVCVDAPSEMRYVAPTESVGTGLSIWVAVRDGRHVHGVLAIRFSKSRSLDDSDMEFVQTISNVLSTALHRLESEASRRRGEAQLRRLVDHLPAGAVYVSGDTLFVNQAVESIFGCLSTDLGRRSDWEARVVNRSQAVPFEETVHSPRGTISHRSETIQRSDGQNRLIEITQFSSENDEVWLIHDVTEARQNAERSLRGERLAAIGQMITGLAHESRNALQRIRACSEMLEFEVEQNPKAMDLVTRLNRAQDDLQTLYDEVRNYAAPITLELRPTLLDRVVREAWDSVAMLKDGSSATLDVRGIDESGVVQADSFRLRQLFRNLFENSRSAGASSVTVEGKEVCESGRHWVYLRVKDNGPGLSEEVRERVFEPFFTTKTKGTGLGMAIAQRIVDAHGGRIELAPPGHSGAEFVISLPRDGRD